MRRERLSKPAAESLGYRQPAYYKHAIRAGENRLAVHFDQLDAPTLGRIVRATEDVLVE